MCQGCAGGRLNAWLHASLRPTRGPNNFKQLPKYTKILKQDTNIYGFDAKTGIRLDLEDPNWIWRREDNGGAGTIQIRMHQEYGYSLNIQQGDFELYDYRLGEGANNTIDITQTGQ